MQGVASDKYAIGYSGIGYKTADVRAVPLAERREVEGRRGDRRERLHGRRIRWRASCTCTSTTSRARELDPLRREFVRYVLSQQGQEDVVKDGYYPLTAKLVGDALKTVGLEAATVEAGAAK